MTVTSALSGEANGTSHHAGLVIELHGEIDLAIDQVSAPRTLIPRDTTGTVTVDLAGVTFLDSSGINLLIRLRQRADELDVAFRLVAVPDSARCTLHYAGLVTYLNAT